MYMCVCVYVYTHTHISSLKAYLPEELLLQPCCSCLLEKRVFLLLQPCINFYFCMRGAREKKGSWL